MGEKEYFDAREKAKTAIARTLSGQTAFEDYDLPEYVGEQMDNMPIHSADGTFDLPDLPPALVDAEDWDNPFPMLERPMGG